MYTSAKADCALSGKPWLLRIGSAAAPRSSYLHVIFFAPDKLASCMSLLHAEGLHTQHHAAELAKIFIMLFGTVN